MYKKYQEIELKIEKAIFQAKYLSHLENGEVVILDGFSYPGEKVKAVLTKHHKDYWEAKILEVLDANQEVRIEPKCPYFGKCGGCQYQHLKYDAQVELKKEILFADLEKFASLKKFQFDGLVESPLQWRYRNKSELNFADDDKFGFALGQCYRGQWRKIVDMEDCYIFPEEIKIILEAVRNWKDKYNLTSFNRYKYIGFLRHLIMRHSYHYNEWMFIINTSDDWPEFFDDVDILASIKQLFKPLISDLEKKLNLRSFVWRLTKLRRKKGETYEDHVIYGDKYLRERLLNIEYRIKADAFFQNNTLQAENLIQYVLDYLDLDEKKESKILDLYCGVGTFTLPLAKKYKNKKIIGLELVAGAIEVAKENAEYNNLKNLDFIVGDVSKVIDDFKNDSYEAVIVDPPRAGLSKKVVNFLLDSNVPEIIYVSCNPSTLSRDLKLLNEKYKVERLVALDLFPQTYHLESIVKLRKK